MSTLMPDTITTPAFRAGRPTWLWQPYIPYGKITLLAGDPGLGKSFLALDIAARLSTARPMPGPNPGIISLGAPPIGNRKSEIGNPYDTLLFSAEDELHDTILPRLAALGADPERIHPLRCLDAHTQYPQPFSLKEDIGEFSFAIEEHNAKLVILDPITAFMQGIDLNSTAAIRQHLTPLAHLAAFYGIAILAITHLNKEAHRQSLYRAAGSLALAAIARSVLLLHPAPNPGIISLAPDPSIENRNSKIENPLTLLSPIKSNFATPPAPLPFRLVNNTVDWLPHLAAALGAAHHTQDSELSTQNSELNFFDLHDRQTAIDFLQQSLAEGPQPAIPLIRQAKSLAISERTLKRAKAQLGILSKKDGLNQWLWLLPEQSPI